MSTIINQSVETEDYVKHFTKFLKSKRIRFEDIEALYYESNSFKWKKTDSVYKALFNYKDDFFIYAFYWRDTSQKCDYWAKISRLWGKYLKRNLT